MTQKSRREQVPDPGFEARERAAAQTLIELSLEEDGARDDVTTQLSIPAGAVGRVAIVSRAEGALAGLPCVQLTIDMLGGGATVEELCQDGARLVPGSRIAIIEGALRTILTAERSFLNLLGMLSGTASLTRRFVDRAGESCAVLDTRKTWPGGRILQKYAVRCGGGRNHRMGLSDAIMVKDNHRAGGIPLAEFVQRARIERPGLPIIVEADDLTTLEEALSLPIQRILLDNFEAERVRRAVSIRDRVAPEIALEVSGGVNLDTVAAFAKAGADMVSVGALTHSAPCLDIGLDHLDASAT